LLCSSPLPGFGIGGSEAKDSCNAMLVLLAISLVVFVGLNPVNYPNPVRGVWAGMPIRNESSRFKKRFARGAEYLERTPLRPGND